MRGINKVTLVGHLGRDPEARTLDDSGTMATLSVATSESWIDKRSGERRGRTEWHRVVIFQDQLAKVAERYLLKGSKVYIEGTLRTRKWSDNAGIDRYTTEVVLEPFTGVLSLLDSAGDRERREAGSPANGTGESPPPHDGTDQPTGLDDEMPF